MRMSEELKRCPFCGSPAELIRGDDDYCAECSNDKCRADRPGWWTKEEAIRVWNTRPRESRLAEENAKLRELLAGWKTFWLRHSDGDEHALALLERTREALGEK